MRTGKQDFIPATMARSIGDGVFFRPIKSWHSGTFAGEGLFKIPGTDDGSGCLKKTNVPYEDMTWAPCTVTHRLYWHERNPEKTVSAFLSYPNKMGACDNYFWEIYSGDYGIADGDCQRFIYGNAEEEMEQVIKKYFLESEYALR